VFIQCANCGTRYRVDDDKVARLRERNPACKSCGKPVFAAAAAAGDGSGTGDALPEKIGGYRIETLLGRGGMGAVYKGWDESLQRFVAIKVLPSEYGRDQAARERFLIEARALARLIHPNITQIFTAGSEGDRPYFAMEFVDGPSVRDLLRQHGALEPVEAVRIVRGVSQGLQHAQRSDIVHRDIKPGNILIAADGTPKITDFGLAKLVKEDLQLTATGMVMGTPSYISPEQAKGEPSDFRADIYSLGATLYELVMGKPPFQADSAMTMLMKHINEPVRFPVAVREAAVPPVMTGVIRRMMAKTPDARHLSYDQLIGELEQLEARLREIAKQSALAAAPVAVASAPVAGRGGSWWKLAAAVIVLGGLYLALSGRVQQPADDVPVLKPLPAAAVEQAPPPEQAPPQPATQEAPAVRTAELAVEQSFVELLGQDRLRVFGTVRNLEAGPVRDAHLEIVLYNAVDSELARQIVQPEPSALLAGETARFSALFNGAAGMERYEVRPWSGAPSGAPGARAP
jgi:serine/threonine-protein kinase